MKRKVLALVLAIAMTMSLAACGNNEVVNTGKETNGTNDEVVATPEELTVGVFYYSFSDVYIASVRTALDTQLGTLGVTYQNYDGNSNQTTQNEQIDTAISQGTDLLIVNIVTSGSVDSSEAIINKASAAGVPVIFFNRALAPDGEDAAVLASYEACAFVGTDAPEAGHMQGKMIGDYVVANFDALDLNADGKISYAMFKGQEGNVEAIYRTQFAVEDANAIISAAGLENLMYFEASNKDSYQVDLDGNWSAMAANNYMVTNLAQFNEAHDSMIELVICNNDGMAEGVVSALNDSGYNLGEGSKTIPVFGVDATDAAKQLIGEGKMTGTIKQDAEGMAACIAALTGNVQAGSKVMDGTDAYNVDANVANKIYIPYAMYTAE